MRRAFVVWVAAVALLVGMAGPANAATVTVPSNGSPDLSKMVVQNASTAVVVKLYGTGGASKVRWSFVRLKGRDGVTYEAKAAWYGDRWITSLYRGSTRVTCSNFRYTWNATGKFWRVFVPRTCLRRLTDTIRAYAEHVAMSPMPGSAGWSPWVRRG